MLIKLGIVNGGTKSYKVFTENIEPNFMTNTDGASDYVRNCWNKYKRSGFYNRNSNALNGKIFELIIATLLVKNWIVPLFLQAQVAFVPNVTYDMLLYNDKGVPITLSIKTSLRERYKQADLEAIVLKNVHRKARNYLITLSGQEAESISRKIKSKDIMGIDELIVADSEDMDSFIDELKRMHLTFPEAVEIITAPEKITLEDIERVNNK